MKTLWDCANRISVRLYISALLEAIAGVMIGGVIGGALIGVALIFAAYGGQAAAEDSMDRQLEDLMQKQENVK